MNNIDFPKPLKQLLEDSDLQAPIRAFADRTGEILADNKLPFFPDYTDHGTDHINRVLKTEVELVPKSIWANSKKDSEPRLLSDADAAVIIGATLLHDIAMHLRASGFRELVSVDSRFQALSWFKESHEGHSADRPWHELWEDYRREARRFSQRELGNIIGEESARSWKFHDLPQDTGEWEGNHRLIIGEFIRRHHARLAHEIAIYGFPGLPVGSGEGQFPAMGKEEGHPLMRLADLIGLSARSHWLSLRVCKSYLEASPLYPGTPRPMGTAIFYPMALLRVADYLQIDRQRAPAVLLQLRNPQSPVSVQEWKKHRAVQNIGPAIASRGKMITVSNDLSLTVYLQLRELLAGLQAEMDHSTAVLDEVYGTLTELGLNQLNLATRRVYSNLQSPAFRDSLPYVPDRTGFTADPNLLTLLVEPLYGKQPSVGVRELMQNAADAVCELEAWCAAHGVKAESLELPELDGDVLIEFIKREDGTWFLRSQDRGIGMTSDTIQNYFLRAGASFRRSAEWAKEFLDESGRSRVIRAGRFGIGAFAVFLLGSSFRLWTRHVAADKSMGYLIEASANSQLIEIKRAGGLTIGTTIEIELSNEAVSGLSLEPKESLSYDGPAPQTDWFCWDWPKIVKRVIRGPNTELLAQEFHSPIRKSKLPPEWSVIYPAGFDAVYWTFSDGPSLSCNGLKIANPGSFHVRAFRWPERAQLDRPCVAVLDSAANLPLTTQRYKLSQENVPFVDELVREVTISFIAHALVCGPTSRAEALSFQYGHPLRLGNRSQYHLAYSEPPFAEGYLRWCATSAEMIPTDAWLYSLLKTESCLVYGSLMSKRHSHRPFAGPLPMPTETIDHATICWEVSVDTYMDDDQGEIRRFATLAERILEKLSTEGVRALGHEVEASRVLVSASQAIPFAQTTYEDRALYLDAVGEPLIEIWRKLTKPISGRRWFEALTGTLAPSNPPQTMIELVEVAAMGENIESTYSREMPDVLFVAEIKTRSVDREPESVIARIWHECLGATAIPFDAAARKALIAKGGEHPELKRHIEAWQEMKRTGSKWVTG